MTIAGAHYFGGNPVEVLKAPVNVVMNAYHHINFVSDYREEFLELNKKQK